MGEAIQGGLAIAGLHEKRRTDLPDDLIFRIRVKPSEEKYFSFSETQIRCMDTPSRLIKRDAPDHHECWVRGAMDALACLDEARWCGRQNRVVLVPRRWHQASRKTFRGERRWLSSPDTGALFPAPGSPRLRLISTHRRQICNRRVYHNPVVDVAWVALGLGDGCVSLPYIAGEDGRVRACARQFAGTSRHVPADMDGPRRAPAGR